MGEVEFLTCLFLGGDGWMVSGGDGQNVSERLERMGTAPAVDRTVGLWLLGGSCTGIFKALRGSLFVSRAQCRLCARQ